MNCHRVVALSQAAVCAALLAAALAQVLLATGVRRYALRLGEGEWEGEGWAAEGSEGDDFPSEREGVEVEVRGEKRGEKEEW